MKKLSKVLSATLATSFVFAGVACGIDTNNSRTTLTLIETGGEPILFEYLDAGFGSDPYIAVANAFMEEHPEYQIVTIPNRQISGTTSTNLSANTDVSDIYSYPYGGPIRTWISKGWVEDLTDLCTTQKTLDNRTILESMTGNSAKSISRVDKATNERHIYAIPEYTSVTGFVYNIDLFEENGWKVPNTTKELEDLCKQILNEKGGKVAPIVWCDSADGYLYFATENWISQYEGIDNMNKFHEYASADVYALEDNEAGSIYSAKKASLEAVAKFFTSIKDGGYAHNDSEDLDNVNAQYAVIEGSAAMMLNGSWFENEMVQYLSDERIGMFPLPELSDSYGMPLRADGYTTEDNKRVLTADYGAYYFIPTMAPNKQGAKDFLLYLSSEKACSIYTQYSNAVRPFQYDMSKTSTLYSKVGVFGQSILDIGDQYYLYSVASDSDLAFKGLGGLWARGVRIEREVLGAGVGANVTLYLDKDYGHATKNWQDWLASTGK